MKAPIEALCVTAVEFKRHTAAARLNPTRRLSSRFQQPNKRRGDAECCCLPEKLNVPRRRLVPP